MKATEIIKPEDLRINNCVSFLGEIGTVRTIGNTCAFKTKTTTKRVCTEDFKPIELTEELLLRFGMVKVIGWDDMIFWRLEADKHKGDCFELMESTQGYLTPSDKLCKYAHTLQNCYYFHELSGKELTLK